MGDSEIDVRAILGLLRRRFRLIAITVILIVGAAGLAILALTPIYTASALVMVDPSRKDLLAPDSPIASTNSDSARVESEVELLRSDAVLMTVIADMGLLADSEFGVRLGWTARMLAQLQHGDGALPSGDEALGQVLNTMRAAISVQRRGLTYLISVQARSENPARAAELANAVTQVYIKAQLSSKVDSILASRNILQARIEQARQAIIASEGAFDSYIFDNIDRIASETGNAELATLRDQLAAIAMTRQHSARTVSIVQQSLETGDWGQLAGSMASDGLKALELQRRQIAAELFAFADGSEQAARLRGDLDLVDAGLRATGAVELTALQASIAAGQNSENQLRDGIRAALVNTNLPASVLTQIYALQQNASIARDQYNTLLVRSQNLSAQADLQVADSRVVSPALAPALPSFPNPPLILALSAIAALGVGVGLAFLAENVIGGFSSEEQAESVLRIKVAASLPKMKTGLSEGSGVAELMVNAPISVFSESVRRVRASIDRAARGSAGQGIVVMVSSAAHGEGKTTTALSLARSYALSGKSTLLIDCDLRKPSVHHLLGIEPSIGFIDYLSAHAAKTINIQTITAKDPLSPATIIAGARRSDIPTDQLIAGAAFAQLIHAARHSCDIVVLDTPPIGLVVDGLYISQHADVILYVVRYASTPQTEARKALTSLSAAKPDGIDILAVLNQQDRSPRSYNGRYSAYYAPE